MKRKGIVILLVILLITSFYQYRKIKRYEEALVSTYQLHVNWGGFFGQFDALIQIDSAIEALNKGDKIQLIKSLGKVSEAFKVAEASYVFMEPYVGIKKNDSASFNNHMSWFYRDMSNYIYDLTVNIQQSGIDTERLMLELSQFKDGFEYIKLNMTEKLLKEETIHEINLTWQETIEKVLIDYPDHPGFRSYREKHYRSLSN